MRVDGIELHVEVDGAGPALVLLNGAFCTTRQWDHVLPSLTPNFRVIRLDIRGTGRSAEGPSDGLQFERYADDVIAVVDELGIERTDVWGMAWGARVGLVLAARHPDRVRRVVLTDLAIDPADTDAQRQGALSAKEARRRAGIAEIEPPAGWNDHDDPDATLRALAATRRHPDLLPFVEQVAAPVFLATGDHDPNLVSTRRALAAFSDARLDILPSTAHGSVLQRPDIVVQRVSSFLLADRSPR